MSNLSDFTGGGGSGGTASKFINLNDVSGTVSLDLGLYGNFDMNVIDDVQMKRHGLI